MYIFLDILYTDASKCFYNACVCSFIEAEGNKITCNKAAVQVYTCRAHYFVHKIYYCLNIVSLLYNMNIKLFFVSIGLMNIFLSKPEHP